jgi:hypothetical protein
MGRMAVECPTCASETKLRECPDCGRAPRIVWVERLQRWVKLGGGATIAMTLAACYGPPQTDGRAAYPVDDPTTTPAGTTQRDTGERLGELSIGTKAQQVLTTFGEPKTRTEPEDGQQRWEWPDRGLVLTMIDGPDGYTIHFIEVRAPSTLATSRGIAIGSKRADVETQYGAERDAAASTATKLVTPAVQFTFEGDVVA